MRFATGGESWDRVVPVFALPYAIWTLYVHLIVAAHASFTALLHWLPPVLLVAVAATVGWFRLRDPAGRVDAFPEPPGRSEEHTSELQSLMRISYAVFCLKKTNINTYKNTN